MSDQQSAPSRYLLKLSGEAFGPQGECISAQRLAEIVDKLVHAVARADVQLAIVVGAGNFVRGQQLKQTNISVLPRTLDHIGMLATNMNALALRDAILAKGLSAYACSALAVTGIIDAYDVNQVDSYLSMGHVVVLAGGTGNPFVTTDSAASLRAVELQADELLKASTIDGVYDKDPKQHNDAKRYRQLSYDVAIDNQLAVMDPGAFIQCREHGVAIRVFDLNEPQVFEHVFMGKDVGTLVGDLETKK